MFQEACKRLDADTDEYLREYFTETTAVGELARFDSQKALAVGLKGIGKTATFRYFSDFRKDADVVVGVSPENYALYLPSKNLHFATCRKQFEHDLVMEALRNVVAKRGMLAQKVPKAVLDRAAKEVNSYIQMIKGFAGRFGGISILGCGFTLTKADTPVLVGLRDERDIRRSLETLEDVCSKGVRIRIVVDDPEAVFSATKHLDTHLVGGFCLAALRLSEKVPGLKVLALLKTHVYYPVLREVEDLRKYPEHMARLRWTSEELVELVSRRLTWSAAKWSDFFAGTDKQARELVALMCAQIRNGPRDLLWWIYLSIKAAGKGKITQALVELNRKGLSVQSFGELVSAHAGEYPRIGAVVRTIFGADPSKRYTLKGLKDHISSLLVKDPEMKALSKLPWMQMENSQTLTELLFETGAIALECDGRMILPYEEDYDAEHFETADALFLAPVLTDAVQ